MRHKIEVVSKSYDPNCYIDIDEKCRYTMVDNPFQSNELRSCILEGRVDDEVGGHVFVFPVQLCLKGDIVIAVSGSTLSVEKRFRKYDIGIMLPEAMVNSVPSCLIVGVSKEAQPVYKYLGLCFFDMLRYISIINSHFLVKQKCRGLFAKVVSYPFDVLLHLIYGILSICIKIKYRRFEVIEKKEGEINYQGIESMLSNDPYPYRENHNKAWIDWVLNYHGGIETSEQHLFEIYQKKKLVGFFINKISLRKLLNGKYSNVKYGSLIEWETVDENILKESDICAIAFSQFGLKADAIALCSNKGSFFEHIPKFFRKKMGTLNFAVKLDKIKYPDYIHEDNWRIRPAGGDNSF